MWACSVSLQISRTSIWEYREVVEKTFTKGSGMAVGDLNQSEKQGSWTPGPGLHPGALHLDLCPLSPVQHCPLSLGQPCDERPGFANWQAKLLEDLAQLFLRLPWAKTSVLEIRVSEVVCGRFKLWSPAIIMMWYIVRNSLEIVRNSSAEPFWTVRRESLRHEIGVASILCTSVWS